MFKIEKLKINKFLKFIKNSMSTFTNDLIVNEYLKTERLQQKMNEIMYQPIISDSVKLNDNELFMLPDESFTMGKTSPHKKLKNSLKKIDV